MSRMIVFSLIVFLVACGKHHSESFGQTNNKAVIQGEVSNTAPQMVYDAIAQGNDVDFFKLMQEKENVNLLMKNGKTPLIVAVENRKTFFVFQLMQMGADVSIQDHAQKTALDYAIETEQLRVQILLNPALEQQIQSEYQPLLFKAAKDGSISGIKQFLREGINPNFASENGETVLTQALKSKKLLAVLELLKWKDEPYLMNALDVNLLNQLGERPLALAQKLEATKPADKKNKEKILNAMIESGATL